MIRDRHRSPDIGVGRWDVRVIATDEERVMTRATARILAG
jgi:hypothetical protein